MDQQTIVRRIVFDIYAVLDISQQTQSSFVAFSTGILRLQEGINDALGQFRSNDPCSKSNDVGIVMEPGKLGSYRIGTQGTADSFMLVGRNGDSDSGPADQDTLSASPFRIALHTLWA